MLPELSMSLSQALCCTTAEHMQFIIPAAKGTLAKMLQGPEVSTYSWHFLHSFRVTAWPSAGLHILARGFRPCEWDLGVDRECVSHQYLSLTPLSLPF